MDKLSVTIVEINQEQFQANSVSEENYHLENIQVRTEISHRKRKVSDRSESRGMSFRDFSIHLRMPKHTV